MAITVPEYITVHLGAPDQNARNVTVPFADYIKNVASSEIYPTWPENAIRANIYAQVSYTLNRIFTEYYRSRGYDFDITNTTQFDHAYVDGRDIFENISRITDDLFNDYIVRQGNVEPLFAQFCDGIKTQCAGLSQWGSVDLAEAGLLPYQILQDYYGDNIDIIFDAPVGNNIPSYPGVPLRRGSFGEDVRVLKQQLNRISKNYPAIPVIPDTSDAFDLQTEEAVKIFQRIFNLQQDGIVGKATWYKIKQIYSGVKRLSELVSEGITITEAEREYPEELRLGDSGIGVTTLRYYLAFIGYFFDDLPPITVPGSFDNVTQDAVFTFQNKYSLPITGRVDRDTWNQLTKVYNSLLQDLPAEYKEFADEIYPGRFIVPGDTGEAVLIIQENINNIAASDPTVPSVELTGVYDDATVASVAVIQNQLGIEPNGVVGPIVWSRIVTAGSGL